MPAPLFTHTPWFDVQTRQTAEIAKEVSGIDPQNLLNNSLENLSQYFADKYRLEIPELLRDQIDIETHSAKIDVSRSPHHEIADRTRPFMVDGTVIKLTVPFAGDVDAFNIKPSEYSYDPPRVDLTDAALILRIEDTEVKPERVQAEMNRTLDQVEKNLGRLRVDLERWNAGLRALALQKLEVRKEKLLAEQALLAGLGFGVKNKQVSTYAVPELKRAPLPQVPILPETPMDVARSAGNASPGVTPEPVMAVDEYEHILTVIQRMADVMERSPGAFAEASESDLRWHFLVQLNGHYAGQATGETFNFNGRTDILVRSKDKNIFIAECKFWSGLESVFGALDQILRYSSWRDTKVALLIFQRGGKFQSMLDEIRFRTKQHPQFVESLKPRGATQFPFKFKQINDPTREMLITVMCFDIPTPEEVAKSRAQEKIQELP